MAKPYLVGSVETLKNVLRQENKMDLIQMDAQLLDCLLEYAQSSDGDLDLHTVTERAVDLCRGDNFVTMTDYDQLTNIKLSPAEEGIGTVLVILSAVAAIYSAFFAKKFDALKHLAENFESRLKLNVSALKEYKHRLSAAKHFDEKKFAEVEDWYGVIVFKEDYNKLLVFAPKLISICNGNLLFDALHAIHDHLRKGTVTSEVLDGISKKLYDSLKSLNGDTLKELFHINFSLIENNGISILDIKSKDPVVDKYAKFKDAEDDPNVVGNLGWKASDVSIAVDKCLQLCSRAEHNNVAILKTANICKQLELALHADANKRVTKEEKHQYQHAIKLTKSLVDDISAIIQRTNYAVLNMCECANGLSKMALRCSDVATDADHDDNEPY